ncbi:hypothetical protein L195_g047797 [Trifolium pratense]|uniref:Uncharacterized protein n=1 Tax=Trifolium pratense TaxID=57577 RepID=A0A2K3MLM7_TRIPR|nr:hypothetical protein L195_g047797 [Trifolium pratense]
MNRKSRSKNGEVTLKIDIDKMDDIVDEYVIVLFGFVGSLTLLRFASIQIQCRFNDLSVVNIAYLDA